MGEFTVPWFILLPTLFDARFVVAHPFLPAREISRQRRVLFGVGGERLLEERVIALAARFEPVNLPAQASLSPIDAARVQEDWAAYLAVRLLAFRLFEDRNRDKRSDAPIPSQHANLLFKRRVVLCRCFVNDI